MNLNKESLALRVTSTVYLFLTGFGTRALSATTPVLNKWIRSQKERLIHCFDFAATRSKLWSSGESPLDQLERRYECNKVLLDRRPSFSNSVRLRWLQSKLWLSSGGVVLSEVGMIVPVTLTLSSVATEAYVCSVCRRWIRSYHEGTRARRRALESLFKTTPREIVIPGILVTFTTKAKYSEDALGTLEEEFTLKAGSLGLRHARIWAYWNAARGVWSRVRAWFSFIHLLKWAFMWFVIHLVRRRH
jgi:hypothetical protein